MLEEIVEFFIFEWQNIIKSIIGVAIVVGIVLVVGLNFWGWFVAYDHSIQPTTTPIGVPVITPIPQGTGGRPVATPITGQGTSSAENTISVDLPVLQENKQFPVVFTRTNSDAPGVYYATLNQGGGDYDGAYIDVPAWEKGGGRVIVQSEFPPIKYYTIYTIKGTSQQAVYDRIHNIIYSMTPNPDILNTNTSYI